MGVNKDVSFTLNTADRHAVAITKEPPAVLAITGATFFSVNENISPPLLRRDYKEPIAVCASSFGGYSKSDVAGNIRSSGGDNGGGSENLILE